MHMTFCTMVELEILKPWEKKKKEFGKIEKIYSVE